MKMCLNAENKTQDLRKLQEGSDELSSFPLFAQVQGQQEVVRASEYVRGVSVCMGACEFVRVGEVLPFCTRARATADSSAGTSTGHWCWPGIVHTSALVALRGGFR